MRLWPAGRRTPTAPPKAAASDVAPAALQKPVVSSLTFAFEAPADFMNLITDGTVAPRVSRAQAMSVPAVKRGRDLICGTLGTLRLKKHDARRRRQPSELLDQPEPDVARSVTMTRTVEDMLFEACAWWRIREFDATGYPSKVERLDPRCVSVQTDGRVYVNGEHVVDAELIRIDSPNDALLVAGARAIRAAAALERTASRYANDPVPMGYLTEEDGAPTRAPEQIEEALDEFEDAKERRSWPFLAGLKPHILQWNAKDLQLAEARDYAVLEISRLIGVDPEELGVSTTSRTYANAEQRRLDLIDFTCAAYVTAIEDRLSMPDVTPPGYYVRAEYGAFLRSDTKTRMETYKLGREVGVYDDARIAELEDIPSATPSAPAAAPATSQEARPVTQQSTADQPPVAFSAPTDAGLTFGFERPVGAEFKASAEKRTVAGLAVPWGAVAWSGGYRWKFAANSLHWAAESRVKLDDNHMPGTELGRAQKLTSSELGLFAEFKVARGAEGDRILQLAEDEVYDGFSVQVDFATDGDGWTADPADDSVRLVHSATLRKVAITATPAFDEARVASVTASREGTSAMTNPAAVQPSTTPGAPAGQPAGFDVQAFTAGLTESVTAAVTAAMANIQAPQADGVPPRQVIPAGRTEVVREAPVYTMNGTGHSFVRDAWRARTENDTEARERLAKYGKQTADFAQKANDQLMFGATTGNASAVIPPGYRPDLYVTQLMKGRPLVESVSRGGLSDATPFTLPKFVSSSGMSSDHVEGTNPTGGTLEIDTITVTPGGISGLFELTREIVDSANPAIDAIAMQAMQESYSQQTEAKVYAELNGTNGQGGTITSGFVPSGAQAATTSGQGDELLTGVRGALALYPFRRFAAPNRALLSQEATSAFATAVGTDGRPLLPSIGAQNASGVGNAVTQGWFVDGLPFQPCWSLTGNASGDTDVLIYNSNDVWAWESPLLTFRFEERGGPARIDLALFGYFATRLLRPVGLSSIRHTAS